MALMDISSCVVNKLKANRQQIIKNAKHAGITPGIVVGQMQNPGPIAHSQMNFLKQRYRWGQNHLVPEVRLAPALLVTGFI